LVLLLRKTINKHILPARRRLGSALERRRARRRGTTVS